MKLSIRVPIVFVVAACGSGARPAPVEPADPVPTDPGAFARADLLTGDWVAAGEGAPVTWLRPRGPGSPIYGVAAAGVPVVWALDDDPVEAPRAERSLRMWRYQADEARVCDEKRDEPEGLVVSCEEGAGGARFWRNGDLLDVEEWSASWGPDLVHLTPVDGQPAPALEEADRRFDADSATRRADAWVAAFAPDGVIWRESNEHRGSDAVRAAIAPLLEDVGLRWEPTVSRMLVPDALAVTAGTYVASPRAGGKASTGTYVTVWRKDPEGWRIIIDLGRPDA